ATPYDDPSSAHTPVAICSAVRASTVPYSPRWSTSTPSKSLFRSAAYATTAPRTTSDAPGTSTRRAHTSPPVNDSAVAAVAPLPRSVAMTCSAALTARRSLLGVVGTAPQPDRLRDVVRGGEQRDGDRSGHRDMHHPQHHLGEGVLPQPKGEHVAAERHRLQGGLDLAAAAGRHHPVAEHHE